MSRFAALFARSGVVAVLAACQSSPDPWLAESVSKDLGQSQGWTRWSSPRALLGAGAQRGGHAHGGARFVDLQGPDMDSSIAWQTNRASQVVGAAYDVETGSQPGYLWDGGAFTFFAPPHSLQTNAHEINNFGQVVLLTVSEDRNQQVLLYTPGRGGAEPTTTVISTASGDVGGETIGADLNDAGQIALLVTDNWDTGPRTLIWSPDPGDRTRGHAVDIGSLGGGHTTGFHLNEYGQIAGVTYDADLVKHAFLWTPDVRNGSRGQMTDLGRAPGFTGFMENPLYGDALNERGQVVFDRASDDPNSGGAPWGVAVFTPDSPHAATGRAELITDADHLGDGYSINDRGQVTGLRVDLEYNFEGFLYTPGAGGGGTVTSLGANSQPFSLNDAGQVGGALVTDEHPVGYAFVWTPDHAGGTTGTFANALEGSSCSFGAGLSLDDRGRLVGGCGDEQLLDSHAFMYLSR